MSIRRDASGDTPLEVTFGSALGASGGTVTFWMKRVANGGGWDVPVTWDSDSTAQYIYITRNGSNNNWDSYAPNLEHSNVLDTPPTADAWYFVAMTYLEATTFEVFWKEDGDAGLTDEGNSPGTNMNSIDHLMLTESPWGGEWFNGSLVAVKAWDTVLTQTEIETEMDEQAAQKTSDLIGEWYLNDTATMLTDSSAAGNDLSGGTGLTTDTDVPDDLNLATAGETAFIGWGIPAGIT